MKSKILIAAAATLLLSQAAFAHPPGGPGKHGALLLQKLDTNGDGQLSQAEIEAAQTERFAKFDTDGNGQLNLEEFQALWLDRMGDRITARFQALDADGDGTVSLTEMEAPVLVLLFFSQERVERERLTHPWLTTVFYIIHNY